MKLTTNLGLKKPDGTDVVNIDDLNYNADILDVKINTIGNSISENKTNILEIKTILRKTGITYLNGWKIKNPLNELCYVSNGVVNLKLLLDNTKGVLSVGTVICNIPPELRPKDWITGCIINQDGKLTTVAISNTTGDVTLQATTTVHNVWTYLNISYIK